MLPANLVEEHLARAEWSWRIGRFLQRSAVIGIVTLGCLLALGFLARVGLLNHLGLAVLLVLLILFVSGLVWLVTALVTLTAPLHRARLGMQLEQVEPRLLDRVNALVHLEEKLDKSSPFLVHLANQSAEVLTTPGAGRPRIAPQVVRMLAVLMVVTLLTAAFYSFFQPFHHIRQAELAAAELRKQDEDPHRLVIPDDTWLEESPAEMKEEEEQLWTEIRIRDPGRDLRATRYDLIPLVIEAYSTEPLDEILLTIQVLGREPEQIAFPAPEDPHYALQEYELDLLSLDVSEWDVIQYFAEARTREPRKSELYFIDVLPTQEELEQLAKDADDESYRTLRELTHLIQQQQDVLRDQHQVPTNREQDPLAAPDASESTRQNRIAEQQSRLAEEAQKLADRLSAVSETSPAERSPSEAADPPEISEEGGEGDTDRTPKEETATPPSSEQSTEAPDTIPPSSSPTPESTSPENTSPENPPSGQTLPERLQQIAEQLGLASEMARSPSPEQTRERSREPSTEQSSEQSREQLTSQLNDSLCQLAEARREAACQIQQRGAGSTEGEDHTEEEGLPEEEGLTKDEDQSSDGKEREQGDSPGPSEDSRGEEASSDEAQEGEGEGAGGAGGEGAESSGGASRGDKAEAGESGGPGDGMSEGVGGSSDELRESGREAWRRAARQLESLERRQASGQPLDPQQERLLRDDTASRLARAIDSWLGANQSSEPPLARLREELEQPRDAMDWRLIRELMEQVQRQRRESMPRSDSEATTAELQNIESSRFSPAYRDALERYFQKLSESP